MTLRASVIDTQAAQGRDRFEDPRETAVKSDVKIKARFTPPRDPREKVERPGSGEGRHSRGIYTCRPVMETGICGGGSAEVKRERKYGDKKRGRRTGQRVREMDREEDRAKECERISRPAFM